MAATFIKTALSESGKHPSSIPLLLLFQLPSYMLPEMFPLVGIHLITHSLSWVFCKPDQILQKITASKYVDQRILSNEDTPFDGS